MHWIRFAWMLIVLVTIGCGGGGSSKVGADDSARFRAAASMYNFYISENGGKTPADEQAFRTYLESKKDQLDKMGVTVDELLTSPRNGEAMVFVYGKKPVEGPGVTYMAYEKTPVNGKRLVIASRGFEEMDEARFKQVFPDAQ